MKQTVFGIFDKRHEAQNAVNKLIEKGFVREDIDFIDNAAATQGDTHTTARTTETDTGGRVKNFFNNLFGSNTEEARTYSEVAGRSAVVTVHAHSREEADRAASILDEYGAIDANERVRSYRSETGTATDRRGETATGESIPVVEEKMEVGKRDVETGKVRLRSRIIERPVEEKLRLREEHVTVDRKPVDRTATEKDLKNFREGETEITEHAEKPVVKKEARVVEEVNLEKESKERSQTIRDSVRKQDVDVKKTNKDKEADRKNR
jgi:stress response protein YsnF